MAEVYLQQQQRENGDPLTYPTEMEKVWPIIFFKSVEREGCFPSYLKSFHVPLTTSTAVLPVWHMLWSVSEESSDCSKENEADIL